MPCDPLTLRFAASAAYAVVGEEAVDFTLEISGGAAPYTVLFTVAVGENPPHPETVTYEESGSHSLRFTPTAPGTHLVSVEISDSLANRLQEECSIPVADRSAEDAEIWAESVSGVTLSGNWAEDILAVARSQLGYCASSTNFIIDEDGITRRYTRYGHLYGCPYADWCAMFVSFCLQYAGIPETALPQEAGCQHWMNTLSGMGVFINEGHTPSAGDLVFFGENGQSSHVGIVSGAEDGTLYAIEGNHTDCVSEFSYSMEDERILGYASMDAVSRRYSTFRAVELYKGDDTDLIPAGKKAVAVSIGSIPGGSRLIYNDGSYETEFLYNAAISEKSGLPSYVALVDAATETGRFANRDSYTVGDGPAVALVFGDSNGDGIANAQEALAAIHAWLRNGEALSDTGILALNVNGDGCINAFDALGIVEAYVNGSPYGVVTKAVAETGLS